MHDFLSLLRKHYLVFGSLKHLRCNASEIMNVSKINKDAHQKRRHDLVRMVHGATRRIHLWDLRGGPAQQLVHIPQLKFVREFGERDEIRYAKGRCGGLEKPWLGCDRDCSQRRKATSRTTSNGNTRLIDERMGGCCEQLGGILDVLDVHNPPVFSEAGSETG